MDFFVFIYFVYFNKKTIIGLYFVTWSASVSENVRAVVSVIVIQ